MLESRLQPSPIDPTPIFELFRGSYGTELLTAAAAHFHLFQLLTAEPLSLAELGTALSLQARPTIVLVTALRAMGLLQLDSAGKLTPTPLAALHLVPDQPHDVTGYLSLAANSPGVLEMVERLRTNRPAGADAPDEGAAFIYREDFPSAMEQADSARRFTLALAGRAKVVAPHLAEQAPLDDVRTLLDVAGGTGIYAYACLQRHPHLQAVIFDRPEVLRVAEEAAAAYGVQDRAKFVAGDMFTTAWPKCDAVLLSNVLHDWDQPQCEQLLSLAWKALPHAGKVLIHDVFLNDALDGPLPVALYSAALFCFCEGRAYSAAEYNDWLRGAGFQPGIVRPTAVHCGVLTGIKL